MHIQVNGVRLYFDVEGAGLVPDGRRVRQKPTLLMLHGGPGASLDVARTEAFKAQAERAPNVRSRGHTWQLVCTAMGRSIGRS
jgi:proline iminopeptidase